MYFKQFYLGCLAHASYLIGSEGEAAVVDPQRDVEQYLAEADAHGLKIKYVIETHLHADFVSGHRELADRAGAEIVFGQQAGVKFPHLAAKDGDQLEVGSVILRILETPGHTPESISILVIDRARRTAHLRTEPLKVLTGDTLFIGDVGRPDLAGGKGFTAEQMAGMLYDSLRNKLMTLDDSVEVYPAHGAGSLCGKNISKDTSSTIGQQRRFNYALQPMTKDEFVRMVTANLPEVPAYFPKDAEINREGAHALAEIQPPPALTPEEVKRQMEQGAMVLDVRTADSFGAGHIPGALNIGLGGQFASWAGTLIAMGTPIIVVADTEAQVNEAATRLARVGIESEKGFLRGGMEAWSQAGFPVATVTQMTVHDLKRWLDEQREVQWMDVRRPGEYDGAHAPTAAGAQLAELEKRVGQFDPKATTAVICAGGYRSAAATSILARHGFDKLYNVTGGTGAWVEAGYPVAGATGAD
jgi:glyoxylase-like metal-dependent hydrolase (beta-lactamase superfamily II)/rhodanese-related sulfurtransferase